jgi:hypothetical protein
MCEPCDKDLCEACVKQMTLFEGDL